MSSCSIYTTFEQFNYGEKKLDPHSAGIYFQFLSFKTWRNLCLGRFFSRKNTAVPNHYRTLAGWGSTLTVAYWRRGAAYEKTHREEIYLSLNKLPFPRRLLWLQFPPCGTWSACTRARGGVQVRNALKYRSGSFIVYLYPSCLPEETLSKGPIDTPTKDGTGVR
jgi:hypothetical protein